MNRKIFILILGILILSSCKQKSGIEYSFADVQIKKTDYYLTLPIGIEKNEVEDYTEGIFQNFIYSDKSFVIISTSGFGQIKSPENEYPEFHWRKEKIDGIQITYGNVKTERKAEFDKAFDLMKENRIKKK
ncbi:hypothetical protein DS884_11160 [Tenacibaculum sp. E3R01]|nr:hypothetical protein DS884_11160 [Tenacibaculum sp. E3R01]